MADAVLESSGAGLSGHAVRGAIEAPDQPAAVADATVHTLEETVKNAADFALRALDLTGQALGQAVDVVSDKAFQQAANVGPNIASPQTGQIGQTAFSWSGYMQALGIMCILLAALWFGVWALRKYGRFNFLPRPGALPKDSLVMEAQMPLGPKKGLMVIRFMDRRLLLGVTEHQISLLTEDKRQDERPAANFKDILDHTTPSHSDPTN